MNNFIHDHFLLQSGTAEKLYHDYAKGMPIIDYHNHLPPNEIADNKKFNTIFFIIIYYLILFPTSLFNWLFGLFPIFSLKF